VVTVESLQEKTIREIDGICSEVTDEITQNGYMDHAVRAVEDLIISKLKKQEKENAMVENRFENPVYYKISKHINDSLKPGQGCAYSYDEGLEISYSQEGTRLDIILSISHELGHEILDHLKIDSSSNNIRDLTLESQASYFAIKIAIHRSAQYGNDSYIKSNFCNESDIVRSIARIHKGYDENLIKK